VRPSDRELGTNLVQEKVSHEMGSTIHAWVLSTKNGTGGQKGMI
jgi:hypothetical protein